MRSGILLACLAFLVGALVWAQGAPDEPRPKPGAGKPTPAEKPPVPPVVKPPVVKPPVIIKPVVKPPVPPPPVLDDPPPLLDPRGTKKAPATIPSDKEVLEAAGFKSDAESLLEFFR